MTNANAQTEPPADASPNAGNSMLSVLVGLAALVIVIAGMRAAADLVTPFLLSIFLAILCGPPLRWLRQRGVPRGLGMVIVLSVFIGVGIVVATLVAGTVNRFVQDFTAESAAADSTGHNNSGTAEDGNSDSQRVNYRERLIGIRRDWNDWIQDSVEDHPWMAKLEIGDISGVWTRWTAPDALMTYFSGALRTLGGTLSQAFLILLTTAFILVEASLLPDKLRAAFPGTLEGAEDLNQIVQQISRYMGIKTWTSLITGGTITIAMLALGVNYPVLWGLLAFLLNYVPNIGSILAAVPAVLLAFLQYDLKTAAIAAVVYLAVNLLVGNLLEPRWMGRGLGLSTLVVFVSLVFWGWVLGPVGMVISVPLTMAVKIALEGNEESRWVAILLGTPSGATESNRG